MRVIDSTLSGNHANNSRLGGGGVLNDGTMTVSGSTVSGNYANNGASGVGIYNLGDLTATASTISENSASSLGGGIDNHRGSLHVTNSTVARNAAGHGGGGIMGEVNTSIVLTNVTVAANSMTRPFPASVLPDGVYSYSSMTTLVNTIVADFLSGPVTLSLRG
jgi:hypothetical protein